MVSGLRLGEHLVTLFCDERYDYSEAFAFIDAALYAVLRRVSLP
jgi:hypothetical protein